MRRFRTAFAVLLGLLLLFDGVMAFRIWWYGLKYICVTDGPVSVESAPFTGVDLLVLLLLVAIHAALMYGVWKARRSAPVRV